MLTFLQLPLLCVFIFQTKKVAFHAHLTRHWQTNFTQTWNQSFISGQSRMLIALLCITMRVVSCTIVMDSSKRTKTFCPLRWFNCCDSRLTIWYDFCSSVPSRRWIVVIESEIWTYFNSYSSLSHAKSQTGNLYSALSEPVGKSTVPNNIIKIDTKVTQWWVCSIDFLLILSISFRNTTGTIQQSRPSITVTSTTDGRDILSLLTNGITPANGVRESLVHSLHKAERYQSGKELRHGKGSETAQIHWRHGNHKNTTERILAPDRIRRLPQTLLFPRFRLQWTCRGEPRLMPPPADALKDGRMGTRQVKGFPEIFSHRTVVETVRGTCSQDCHRSVMCAAMARGENLQKAQAGERA